MMDFVLGLVGFLLNMMMRFCVDVLWHFLQRLFGKLGAGLVLLNAFSMVMYHPLPYVWLSLMAWVVLAGVHLLWRPQRF